MAKVAINGFGRIGRTFFRMSIDRPEIEVVAVNDLGDINNLAYLLKFDTAYGRAAFDVEVEGNNLRVNGKLITFVQEKDPKNLPWGSMGIDVVVESTGFFTSYEAAQQHITAGAKRVVISAPSKIQIILMWRG